MTSILEKAHQKAENLLNKLGRPDSRDCNPLKPVGDAICEQDVYRFRRQRGVNLGKQTSILGSFHAFMYQPGSWFVLERWITDVPFQIAQYPGQSDLDVAKGERARETLEEHWDTWITEEDWVWLAEYGINTVRIPASLRDV